MNDNQLKQQKECPHFELDDWGVCTYQYDWMEDVCKDNCVYNYDKNIVESINKSNDKHAELMKKLAGNQPKYKIIRKDNSNG